MKHVHKPTYHAYFRNNYTHAHIYIHLFCLLRIMTACFCFSPQELGEFAAAG